MKNIFYICLALGFMLSSVTFVSCGSDDEKSNPENTNSGGNGSGQDSKPRKIAERDEAGNIKITAANFPDAAFRAYLYDKYGADGVLSDAEIDNVTQLKLGSRGIKTLEGIEFFPLLSRLYCDRNQLTFLDLSQNTKLEVLCCEWNQLTSLDVSKNTQLTRLDCSSNQLSSLDLSKNTALTELYCCQNQINGEGMDALIKSLPTVNNGVIRVYYRFNELNVITSTQVTAAKAKGWTPYYNSPNSIDSWIQYPDVEFVTIITDNVFPDAKFKDYLLSQSYGRDGLLTNEEISGVTYINVSSKSIQSLQGIEYFTALTELSCGANKLTSLDLSKNTALTSLYCYDNQLTSLDVSNNTELTRLECYRNQLTSLDVSKNIALERLYCGGNQLSSLDLSKNTALKELELYSNQFASLNVLKNTNLTTLSCGSNQLTSLDLSKNTVLTELECSSNQLTSLDVSKNTALAELRCYDNHLTSLDVSKNIALRRLDCYSNQLTSLDVSNNIWLNTLHCRSNQFSYLNVEKNTWLDYLDCDPSVTVIGWPK